MADKIQTILPASGKLNWDDDLSMMPSGDGRDRHNVEISEVGKYGRLTNILGDTQIDLGLTANQVVLGGCFDHKRDQYIIVVGDSVSTSHVVKTVDKSTKTVGTLLSSSLLFENGITLTTGGYVYVDCKVVGDLLVWVDGLNENKSFDIVKMQAYTDRTGYAFSGLYVDQGTYGENTIALNMAIPYSFVSSDEVYIVFDDDSYDVLYGGKGVVGTNAIPMSVDIGRYIADDTISTTGDVYHYDGDDQIYKVTKESITWIHPSPTYRPEQYATFDTDKQDVSLINDSKCYQFAYSFIYSDNTESATSSISSESVNLDHLFTDDDVDDYNCIVVILKVDKPNVKRVRLYGREVGDGVSNFYLILDKSRDEFKGNYIEYKFYGNLGSLATTNVDALMIQDYIPKSSESCEVVNENVLVCAGNTEGVDIVDADVDYSWVAEYKESDQFINSRATSTVVYDSPSIINEVIGNDYNQIQSVSITGATSGNTDNGTLYWSIVINDGTHYDFNIFKDSARTTLVAQAAYIEENISSSALILEVGGSGLSGTYSYYAVGAYTEDEGEILTYASVCKYINITESNVTNWNLNYIYRLVYTNGDQSADIYVPSIYNTASSMMQYMVYAANKSMNNDYLWYDATYGIMSTNASTFTVYWYIRETGFRTGGFEDNDTYYFRLNYFDTFGRLSYISNPFQCDIPYLTKNMSGSNNVALSTMGTERVGVYVTINNASPIDEGSYSISVARPSKFWQQLYVLDDHVWDADENNSYLELDYTADTNRTEQKAIAINYDALEKGYPVYEYAQGDSIRLIGYNIQNTFSSPYTYRTEFTSYKFASPIYGTVYTDLGYLVLFVDKTLWDTVDVKNLATLQANDNIVRYVFEVYRNTSVSTENNLYFECTDRFTISGGVHSDTSITVTEGTAFYYDGFLPETRNAYLRSKYHNINATIATRQWGKPIYVSGDLVTKYFNNVRSGGKLYQNTNTNNLFKFDYDDVVYLNDTYGEIKRCVTRGNVLKVYQERKRTSVYIGGTEMSTIDGQTQILRSDKVLGGTRESSDSYGLQVKTALTVSPNAVYFWDVANGVIIKDTDGGMYPIVGRLTAGEYSNDYKMERFFKPLSKAVTNYYNFNTALGYDNDNRRLFVTSTFETDADYATVVFSEENNFWYTFYTQKPYLYISGDLETLYLDSSYDLYSLYTNTTRCNIGGTQRTFSFDVVANQNGSVMKTYEALALKSNIPILAEIEMDATPSYPQVYTRVKKGRWRLEENTYRADILRNMYPENTTYSLHNGAIVRGNAALVTFTAPTGDSDTLVDVLAVDIYYADSSM